LENLVGSKDDLKLGCRFLYIIMIVVRVIFMCFGEVSEYSGSTTNWLPNSPNFLNAFLISLDDAFEVKPKTA
jgi:hypothetical protein